MLTRKSFFKVLKTGALASLLFVLLYAGVLRDPSLGVVGSTLREITALFVDSATQWMFFLYLGIYCAAFLFFRNRTTRCFWRAANPNLWLACGLVIIAALYSTDYVPSTQALALLGGMVLGQGTAFWAERESQNSKFKIQKCFGVLVASILVILLAGASVLPTVASHIYQYRSQARWSSPWDNPNIFGLLMGTGVSLALGMAFAARLLESGKFAALFLCLVAAFLTGRGLLHSYSRGAWLGAVIGLVFLAVYGFSDFRLYQIAVGQSCISRFKKGWFPLSVILASALLLVFWNFRETNWLLARRAFSSINASDFSWRNRISAWEGALQITAEHPLSGTGWGQSQPLYGEYYLPSKLDEAGAIEMNDYFTLGATLGIPALFCFGMYFWLNLMQRAMGTGQNNGQDLGMIWLKSTCRAGAIVLLVGFWFDGGLFELPTTGTFWILLELGSAANREPYEPHENA